MIPLRISSLSDAEARYITRLELQRTSNPEASWCLESNADQSLWCGANGLVQIDYPADELDGDVLIVDPGQGNVERIIRAGSPHNSLLVTEQCDQLCIMCSQPPKKSHTDRFDELTKACLLAEQNSVIGITGGEPTLHKQALFDMIENVHANRGDLSFHILSNGQHFSQADIDRLSQTAFRKVTWGIPLYSSVASAHDQVVAKPGAFEILEKSLERLFEAGARIELRTVVLRQNLSHLPALAKFVVNWLTHIEQWSIMGLENVGFARNRWDDLFVDYISQFEDIGEALDIATLFGVPARLFNIPICQIPEPFRHLAVASISDWKKRYAGKCNDCLVKSDCSGFFEWHPDELVDRVTPIVRRGT